MAESKEVKIQGLSTGEVALKCAEFFMSLGEYCLDYYHNYNKEVERKTKLIRKAKKPRAKAKQNEDGNCGQEDVAKKIPKKPLTAYIIYFQQKKPNFVEKHPGLNLSELTKLIAKQWKQMNDEQRKPYLDQAQEDRKRYDDEIKEFKVNYGLAHQQIGESENIQGEEIENEEVKQSQVRAQNEDNASEMDEESDEANGDKEAENNESNLQNNE